MPQSLSTWPSNDGLRIGHLNINSALHKMTDISSMLDNNGKPFHVFAFTESSLLLYLTVMPIFQVFRQLEKILQWLTQQDYLCMYMTH